jgi:ABC-type branched-subunit amino acid transport system ATPase component
MTVLLKAQGISRSFGGLQALRGCDLEVHRGSITGLIGPNGSGKTTLFNVITGYVKPDEGTVTFDGADITGFEPDKVFARGIGRTFQLTRIFARMTVLENMLIAIQHEEGWLRGMTRSKSSKAEVDNALEWLDFVGITRLAELEAGSLSYGQRKLLELAYVLVANPDVILLDEPAGGVNLTLINQIADKIRELNAQGKTFLIVEHNMEFVMNLCDSVTVMNQGCNLVSGKPADVRSNPQVLDAYLGGGDDDEDDEVGINA